MAFRWRADDDPTLNAGLVVLENFRGSGPVLLRNSMFLWFFRWGSGPPVPPLDPRMGPDYVYTFWDILKTHFIVRIGPCTTLCVLSIDRQVERERCVFFLNFVILLTQRVRLRISKIRVYLCKKFWSTRCPWVTVLFYKRHLRRWRASEKRFGFLKEERKCSDSSVVRG